MSMLIQKQEIFLRTQNKFYCCDINKFPQNKDESNINVSLCQMSTKQQYKYEWNTLLTQQSKFNEQNMQKWRYYPEKSQGRFIDLMQNYYSDNDNDSCFVKNECFGKYQNQKLLQKEDYNDNYIYSENGNESLTNQMLLNDIEFGVKRDSQSFYAAKQQNLKGQIQLFDKKTLISQIIMQSNLYYSSLHNFNNFHLLAHKTFESTKHSQYNSCIQLIDIQYKEVCQSWGSHKRRYFDNHSFMNKLIMINNSLFMNGRIDNQNNLLTLCLFDKRKQGVACILSTSTDASIMTCMNQIQQRLYSPNHFVDYVHIVPLKQVNDFSYLTVINYGFGGKHYPVLFDIRKNMQYQNITCGWGKPFQNLCLLKIIDNKVWSLQKNIQNYRIKGITLSSYQLMQTEIQ